MLTALAQFALVGYALWSAGSAARAGARAAYVGGDAQVAARSALPEVLARSARISDDCAVKVEVSAPSLIPGVGPIALGARAGLDPEAGGG